jgi:energy-converting hydrogenase Eha subunit A
VSWLLAPVFGLGLAAVALLLGYGGREAAVVGATALLLVAALLAYRHWLERGRR